MISADPMPTAVRRPRDRAGLAMLVIGTLSVVAGGLVAAFTSPLDLSHGSWAAAYLVLVAGVGQQAMGAARLVARAAPADDPAPAGVAQLAAWNVGNVLVLAGTLAAAPVVVDLGGIACAGALVIALTHSRRLVGPLPVLLYRVVLVVLLVSIPVGLVLAHVRA